MSIQNDPFAGLTESGEAPQIHEDLELETMPDEVSELIDKYKLSKQNYECILRAVDESNETSGDLTTGFIRRFSRSYPSIEWVALNCGPGYYELNFTWKGPDDSGKTRSYTANVPINISERFRNEYDDYQHKLRAERFKKKKKFLKDQEEEQRLEDMFLGEKSDKLEDAKKYIDLITSASRDLGLMQPQKTFDWEGILKIVTPLMPALISHLSNSRNKQQEMWNQMMLMMMNNSKENSQQMLELVQRQNGPTNANDYLKEFKDMVFSAMDIKSALTPEKESTVDKIFKMVEGVAPAILQMAAMPKQKMEEDYRYKMASQYVDNSPDFQAVKNDPAALEAFVDRLDEHYGPHQTDQILKVSDIERPQSRMDAYQKYATDVTEEDHEKTDDNGTDSDEQPNQ